MKIKPDFADFIGIECHMTASCEHCEKEEFDVDGCDDTTNLELRLAEQEWNIIDDSLYCPKCYKKEIKRIRENTKEFNKIVKRK